MKLLKEVREERETWPDGTIVATKFFKVSRATRDSFGPFSGGATLARWGYECPQISVSAFEEDGSWNGWGWLHDEMIDAGLDPTQFRMGGESRCRR